MRALETVSTKPAADLSAAWWWVLACSLLALAARAYGLGRQRFIIDEYATAMFATQPAARLLGPDIRTETNPPYYYLLQKAWLVFGDSREAMRSLPVLLGVLAVPLAFLLGRRLVGSRAGFVAAALLATSPLHILFAREIRCYSLLVASALAALTCLAYLLPDPAFSAETRGPRRRSWLWAGYVLATLSSVYAHNTAVLLPALATAVVVWMWGTGRVDQRFAGAWLAANLLIVAAFLPWLSTMVSQAQETLKDFWIPAPTPDWVKGQILGAYPYAKWAKPLVYSLILPGVWALRRRPVVLVLALAMMVGQPLLLYLISLYRPMFIVRTLIWPTILFFVIVGAGVAMVRQRLAFAACVAVLGVIGLASSRDVYAPESRRSDLEPLLEPLKRMDPETDVLVFAPQAIEWEYHYEAHLGDRRTRGLGLSVADKPSQLQTWHDTRLVARSALAAEVRPFEHVWLIRERSPRYPPPAGDGFERVPESLEAISSGRQRWESGPLELVRYDLTP